MPFRVSLDLPTPRVLTPRVLPLDLLLALALAGPGGADIAPATRVAPLSIVV